MDRQNNEIQNESVYSEDRMHSQSDSGSENEFGNISSTVDFINNECFEFIKGILKSLSYIMEFNTELCKEYQDVKDVSAQFANVFCDIKSLNGLYNIIFEKIDSQRRLGTIFLPSIFLDEEVQQSLNIYKSFLSHYAFNAKWLGEFTKENSMYQEICSRIQRRVNSQDMVNLDGCLYTIFNSLFSLALLFNRYNKCFDEGHDCRLLGLDVENQISDLLNDININQKQMYCALKELSQLTGKKKSPKMNTRFICKSAVMALNKKGEGIHRQLVLFSDCIYVTLLPGAITGTCRIKNEISLNNMIISEAADNAFKGIKFKWGLNINAPEGDYDFYFEDEATMLMWKDKLRSVIKEYIDIDVPQVIDISKLGDVAPVWQKDNAARYCNGLFCNQRFTPTSRRHHCRADGLLYCDSCCSFKVKLNFSKSSDSKVCQLCFRILNKDNQNSLNISETKRQLESVFQLKTRTGVKTGWLEERVYNREKSSFNSPVKYFCELDSKDPYLNLYEKYEDKVKHHGIMLLGMDVKDKSSSKYYGSLKSNQFTIEHQDKDEVYLFKAGSAENSEQWVHYLRESINNYFNKE